jgi:threonine aldolase
MRWIDLRSDTVTRPTDGMRRAMAGAVVGDDVYEEDPTVRQLEERMADLLGKEAGLFVASGTMGNLTALLTHAGRGDEIIVGHLAHTFLYEVGGSAGLGSIHTAVLQNTVEGTIPVAAIAEALRNPQDIHAPRTRLICLENTHNRCGGIVLDPVYVDAVAHLAAEGGLAVHLDGARLLNASRALDLPPSRWSQAADSVMVCLSKGLGAPVGSVLCGARDFIRAARRVRKMLGGGMRQAGILAAAGLYALDWHVARLDEDHANARRLAKGISEIAGLASPQAAPPSTAWTNLVYFSIDPTAIEGGAPDGAHLASRLRDHGVLASPIGKSGRELRMVTHLDIHPEDIDVALHALESAMKGT